MMIRSTLLAAVVGVLVGLPAAYVLTTPMRQVLVPAHPPEVATSNAIPLEAWPICTSMDALAEGPTWAPLDPEFAAGKRALAAGDWNGAITALTAAALRDDGNADIENYLGYAYRRLRQLDAAILHYRQAATLNPRHRSAHEHLGEAYLMLANRAKAEEHLAALERICLIWFTEYDDLKRVLAEYDKIASR